jgi:hypothetical protein
MTPQRKEAMWLVADLIVESRAKGHLVDLSWRKWSRCIDRAEALLKALRS